MQDSSRLLEIRDLKVNFFLDEGTVEAVRGISLEIHRNRTLGLVGESGCGKSVLSQAILRIVPDPGKIVEGQILFWRNGNEPVDLVRLDQKGREIRSIRGKEIAIIFQEPMTALSPLYTIGNQITEAIVLHQGVAKKEARQLAIEMLSRVGVPNPDVRIDQYPFELSGGLRQRAVIAMALVCHPKLLMADEPTTALDVTIQAQILRLFQDLQAEFDMSVLFITHDLSVISEIADEVVVMYLGRSVEQGPTEEIFAFPRHPYTQGLLRSVHRLGRGTGERLVPIKGTIPDPFEKVAGCPFYPRCPIGDAKKCLDAVPALAPISDEHKVACFLAGQQSA
jgi:oligopeptide/dipeptide ABC transporter ATP-binding protein